MTTAGLLILGLAIIANTVVAVTFVLIRRTRRLTLLAAVLYAFVWTPPVQAWALGYTPYLVWQRRKAKGLAAPGFVSAP